MKIVVGLGNPGQRTRRPHNIGWMVVDRLADRAGWAGRARNKEAAATVGGRFKGLDLVLVKPMTFMNESGIAVRKILAGARRWSTCSSSRTTSRSRSASSASAGGGPGGHNGLRSIIDELGTEKFSRPGRHRRAGARRDRPCPGGSRRTSASASTSCSTPAPTRSRPGPRGVNRASSRSTASSSGRRTSSWPSRARWTARPVPTRSRRTRTGWRKPRPAGDERVTPPPLRETRAGAPAGRADRRELAARHPEPAARRPTSPRSTRGRTPAEPRRRPGSRWRKPAGRPDRTDRDRSPPRRRRPGDACPDLSALPPLLAATGSFAALRERLGI